MNIINEKINTAIEVLKNFIVAMNKWEVEYYQKAKDQGLSPLRADMQKDLVIIFNKYCTIKERKYGKPAHFSVGNPPIYSPDEEILKTEELKGNKIVIYTLQKTRVENEFRYTLHFKNSEWRIDKKEIYDDYDKKWEKYIL